MATCVRDHNQWETRAVYSLTYRKVVHMKRPNYEHNPNPLDFDISTDLDSDPYEWLDDHKELHGDDLQAFKRMFNRLLLSCLDQDERDVLREAHSSIYLAYYHLIQS